MTKLYTYALGPIDFWEGWIAPETLGAYGNFQVSAWHPDDVLARLDEAKKAASAAGWEGDGDFYMSMLPMRHSHQCEVVVAIKQGNNGTTFIITPVEMPWLGEPHKAPQLKSRWRS